MDTTTLVGVSILLRSDSPHHLMAENGRDKLRKCKCPDPAKLPTQESIDRLAREMDVRSAINWKAGWNCEKCGGRRFEVLRSQKAVVKY